MKSPPIEPAITGPRSLRDPRSREYAIQTMRHLKRCLESKKLDAQAVERELKLIEEHQHWQVCGFTNIDSYLQSEVGVTLNQLQRRLAIDLAADPNVTPLPEAEKGGRGKTRSDRTGLRRGENAAYLVRRLKRDHPKIAEALARGDYPSARAAAIAAGIITPKTAFERMAKLAPKLSNAEWKRFKANEDQRRGSRRTARNDPKLL